MRQSNRCVKNRHVPSLAELGDVAGCGGFGIGGV